jgi:hypothetical protein
VRNTYPEKYLPSLCKLGLLVVGNQTGGNVCGFNRPTRPRCSPRNGPIAWDTADYGSGAKSGKGGEGLS